MFADTDVPILAINGTLDPASTITQAIPVGEHFDGPNQHFVAIPGGSHSWTSPTRDGSGCAENIFFGFLQDPEAPLLDCVPDILPLDFTGTPALASQLGTTDLWENGAAAATADPLTLARLRDHTTRAHHATW